METKIKKTKKGLCPYCKTLSYERTDFSMDDDIVYFHCVCHKCSKKFIDVFHLVYQEFEVKKQNGKN